MSHNHIREFEITDDIRKLGFSRIYATGKTLVLKGTGENSTIYCRFHKDDVTKTAAEIESSLSSHYDEESITKLCTLFIQVWLASVEAEAEKANIAHAQERNQRESIRSAG